MNGKAVRPPELRPYEEPIAATIARYINAPNMRGALLLASELLNYRSRHDWAWELQLQKQMTRLRDAGVTPRELLLKVATVWALGADRQRFDGPRELHFALAKEVLKLRKLGTWRPVGSLLSRFGAMIQEDLGLIAAGLRIRTQKDTDARVEAKRPTAAGWQLDGE